MTESTDNSGKKLGRLPEDTSRRKVEVGQFLKNYGNGTAQPVYPATDRIAELSYPMDHNDTAGDCVIAGLDHLLRVQYTLLTGSYEQPDDATLLKWYQTQNPDVTSWSQEGNGMIIAKFLDWCVAQGIIIAYGKIDTSNPSEVEAAIYVGLAIITGATLLEANQRGKTWNYVPGSPEWGGHCTDWNGYWPPRVITWGADDYTMTASFITHQVDEAYFVLTQPMLDHPNFRDNFDIAGFASAVSTITNGKVVVPVTPTPTPTPEPTSSTTVTLTDAVAEHVNASAAKAGLNASEWTNNHFTKYFKLG